MHYTGELSDEFAKKTEPYIRFLAGNVQGGGAVHTERSRVGTSVLSRSTRPTQHATHTTLPQRMHQGVGVALYLFL